MSDVNKAISNAWDLIRKGELQQSIQAFTAIVQGDPNNIDARYGYGLALAKNGQNAEARQNYEVALQVAEDELEELRNGERKHDLSTNRDDRLMMIIRMISQRISEVSV